MKKICLYAKRQKKLIAITLAILSIGFVILMLYVHFDYEKNFWMYRDSEVIGMLKTTGIYAFICAVIIVTELYFPNLKARWKQYRIRKRNHSVQSRWYESPMNSIFVVLCWIWLINNVGKVLVTLWMIGLSNDCDGVLIYDAIVGCVMCVILWGIMKGRGTAFILFVSIELINGCVRAEMEREGVHLLVSFLLCGIMALLLLLKNKEGKNGYDIMFNKEKNGQEKSSIASETSMPNEGVINQDVSNSMAAKPQDQSQLESVNIDINQQPTVSMYCDNCGKAIDADSIYCDHCGKKLK